MDARYRKAKLSPGFLVHLHPTHRTCFLFIGMTSSDTSHCQPERKYVGDKSVAPNRENPIKRWALDCFAYTRGDENEMGTSGALGVVLNS